MKRVVFIVEGDTEVSFIQKRVIPYLYSKGFTNPMNAQKILTNRKLNKKGGNVGFEYLKNDVSRVAATKNVLITTLLDFFRLPTDFPGYTTDSLRLPDMEQGIKEKVTEFMDASCFLPYIYNPQIQISAESETKRSIFREKDKTKRSKKESAQHSKSRNKSFVMTSVSAL